MDLGFKLTVPVMSDAFHIFENRLEIIGDTLIEAFGNVRNESGATIASNCLGDVIKPEKNLKKQDVLYFLYSKIHQNNKEEVIMKILDMHKVGLHGLEEPIKYRFLTLSPIFYKWVIEAFDPCTEITRKCFDDILESRICADLYLQQNPGQDIPGDMTDSAFKAIRSLYRDYCNENVPFGLSHLQYLTKSRAIDIIRPFFEIALPNILQNNGSNRLNNDLKFNYKNDVDASEWIKKL
ncbi:18840_t:CDS:1, partial [Racocetra fulgida]